MIKIALATIFVLGLSWPHSTWAVNWEAMGANNEGVEMLMEDRNFEAYEKFVESLAAAPFQAAVHFNLGLAFLKNKEREQALREFKTLGEKARDPRLRFQALFNAALIESMEKKFDQALELYQKALALRPESDKVKTNIELLIKRQMQMQKQKKKQQKKKQKGGGGSGEPDKSEEGESKEKEKEEKEEKDGEGGGRGRKKQKR